MKRQTKPPEVADLTLCPECDRDLVYPVEWDEASRTHWNVELHCPNCGWGETGAYDQQTVDAFDVKLDAAREALVKAGHGADQHGR